MKSHTNSVKLSENNNKNNYYSNQNNQNSQNILGKIKIYFKLNFL